MKLYTITILLFVSIYANAQNHSHQECESGLHAGNIQSIDLKYKSDATSKTIDIQGYVSDDMVFIDGDIAIGTLSDINPREKGATIIGDFRFWTNSTMPYEITPNHPRADDILSAIEEVNESTNLCLIPRSTEDNYVNFFEGQGCWSYLGMIGGPQNISISQYCSRGSVIHEIFHAAGMYHEQSRSDRDSYVTINFENIREGLEGNFQKYSSGQDFGVYDYNSIMHYPQYAFSKNSQPTIELTGQGVSGGNTIGQRNSPSQQDVETINHLYPTECNEDSSAPFCSGLTIIEAASGVINDGSGLLNYREGSLCSWLIQPLSADTIMLSAEFVDIYPEFDYIGIYDGTNSNAPLIGSSDNIQQLYSGVMAFSGAMYIEFSATVDGGDGFEFEFFSSNDDSECENNDINPTISFFNRIETKSDEGVQDLYVFGVDNYSDFPEELFEERIDLSQCSYPSRSTVSIFDENDNIIESICQFNESIDLSKLIVTVPAGNCPPSSVYIEISDLECGSVYQSNTLNLQPYADSTCFNDRPCFPNINEPYIGFGGTEDYSTGGGQNLWTRYRIPVTNWMDIPSELFDPAPDLAPCGLNNNSSRTWLNIYNDQGQRLYGFCALGSNANLSQIWVAFERGTCPPRGVYIQMQDRLCGITYTSPILDLRPYAPEGCYDYYNCLEDIIPAPVVSSSITDSSAQNGYFINLSLSNFAGYDNMIYAPMPNAESCENQNPTRVWLNIYNHLDEIIETYCSISENLLANFTVGFANGECVPDGIYIGLYDAECQTETISDLIDLTSFQTECSDDTCPDLIINELFVDTFSTSYIRYRYSIKNIGTKAANLDGPSGVNFDNVSIQTFLSSDTTFNNSDDVATGGTILGLSPLGYLKPGEVTPLYTFAATPASLDVDDKPFFMIKADWGEVVDECNEGNNVAYSLIRKNEDPEFDCNVNLEYQSVDMFSGNYKASNMIMSSAKINKDMAVTYLAGDEIILYPGFESRDDAEFQAYINDCNEDQSGCTDPNAHNYSMTANSDNGSCETCNDGIPNGDEEGTDCGGERCEPCAMDTLQPADFIGTWENVQMGNSLPILKIRVDNDIFLHGYGSCSPNYCDWGEVDTEAVDAYDSIITFVWDQGFAIRYDTLRYNETGQLERTLFTTYTDNSGRPDRYNYEVFELVTCTDGIKNGFEEGIDCGGDDCSPCAQNCPDLIISEFTYINGTITMTAKNIGGARAEGENRIVMQAYWSDSTAPQGNGASGWTFVALDPGQTWSISTNQTNFNNKPYLVVIVDRDNTIENECDETNNVSYIEL